MTQTSAEELAAALDICGSFNLRRAARVVTQFYDEYLEPTGLRSTQFVLLATIAVAGETGLSRLAREMAMATSTLSRNLKPLERDGLVKIAKGRDSRRRIVALTAAGRRLVDDCVPLWAQAQTAFEATFASSDWRRISAELQATVGRIRAG